VWEAKDCVFCCRSVVSLIYRSASLLKYQSAINHTISDTLCLNKIRLPIGYCEVVNTKLDLMACHIKIKNGEYNECSALALTLKIHASSSPGHI